MITNRNSCQNSFNYMGISQIISQIFLSCLTYLDLLTSKSALPGIIVLYAMIHCRLK